MLKRQLYIVYIISLFLPICIIGSFLLYNNYTMLYEHHQNMLISDNLRIRSIMFEATTSIANECDDIAENNSLHQLLNTEYSSEDEASSALADFTLLDDVYKRYTEISSITLYTDNPTLHTYGRINVIAAVIAAEEDSEEIAEIGSEKTPKEVAEKAAKKVAEVGSKKTPEEIAEEAAEYEWFKSCIMHQGYYWSTLNGVGRYNTPYQELQLINRINIPNSQYSAVLVISISNNYLKNRIDNNDLTVDVTVNHDPIFFSTWGNSNETIDFKSYQNEEYFRYSGVDIYMGEESFLEISTIKPIKSEDSIYVFSRDASALDRIRRIQLIAILIVIMSLLIPSLIIIRYTKQLYNRVDTLRKEMHRVTGGDFNIIENFKGNDELVDLFKDLQVMIISIKDRDRAIFNSKMKEQQLLQHQKEIELELLSSKINPHFLYNTLETIRMKAFNSDNLEVAQAVKLLGRYMRYNLESTGELTTLSSELNYINIYLSIQKLRFSERIDFHIEINQSIDSDKIKILPLLIQPIVENALLHGHEETLENGFIYIKCIDKGEYVRLKVSDNGHGISEENLIAIKEHIVSSNKSHKKSFGLFNVQQRLILLYGKECLLEIESTLGEGTTIAFDIPKKISYKKES